nr:protein arginine N-methyltransferase 3-like [Cherax quadricarinatus]
MGNSSGRHQSSSGKMKGANGKHHKQTPWARHEGAVAKHHEGTKQNFISTNGRHKPQWEHESAFGRASRSSSGRHMKQQGKNLKTARGKQHEGARGNMKGAVARPHVEELTKIEEQPDHDQRTLYNEATYDELREIIVKQREVMQRMLQAVQAVSKNDNGIIKTVGDMRPEEDEGYFNSYAHFDIHHEMLTDRIRTESYRDAIMKNSNLLNGKRVLDLGCGTAILSMFCAKTGAMVTGVDMSDVIYQAMDIVKLVFIQLHSFKCLINDSTLLILFFILISDTYEKIISFWNDVYGFKMSCMQKEVVKEASTDIVKQQHIITSAGNIYTYHPTYDRVRFRETGRKSLTHSHMPARCPSPLLFFLPMLMCLLFGVTGESVEGIICVRRKRKEIRSLDVGISFADQKLKYLVE